MARLKRLLGNLGTAGFGIILAVILLEIIGRALHLVPVPLPDSYQEVREVVGRYPEPYSYFWFNREDGERIWVHFNYRSLRDIDHPYDIDDSKTRIMFLGDSYTAGWQVPLEATYTGRLRQWLPDSGNFDFINAGLHGWGTDRELLYYTHDGYRYNSDIVVLQIYVGNDMLDNGIAVMERFTSTDGRDVIPYNYRGDQPYFTLDDNGELQLTLPVWLPETRVEKIGGVRSFLRHYTFTYALLEQLLQLLKGNSENTSSRGDLEVRLADRLPVDYYAFSPESANREDWQTAWTITQKLILELRNEVEAHGGQLMVLLVDVRWQHDPAGFAELRETWDFPQDWDVTHWGQHYRDFLDTEQIPYVAPIHALLTYHEATGEEIALRQDGHWTAQGHCIVAVELHNWFIEQSIIAETVPPRNALTDCQ